MLYINAVTKYRFGILTGEVGKLIDKDIRMYSEWLGCEISEPKVQVVVIFFWYKFYAVLSVYDIVFLKRSFNKYYSFVKTEGNY